MVRVVPYLLGTLALPTPTGIVKAKPARMDELIRLGHQNWSRDHYNVDFKVAVVTRRRQQSAQSLSRSFVREAKLLRWDLVHPLRRCG